MNLPRIPTQTVEDPQSGSGRPAHIPVIAGNLVTTTKALTVVCVAGSFAVCFMAVVYLLMYFKPVEVLDPIADAVLWRKGHELVLTPSMLRSFCLNQLRGYYETINGVPDLDAVAVTTEKRVLDTFKTEKSSATLSNTISRYALTDYPRRYVDTKLPQYRCLVAAGVLTTFESNPSSTTPFVVNEDRRMTVLYTTTTDHTPENPLGLKVIGHRRFTEWVNNPEALQIWNASTPLDGKLKEVIK